MVPEGSISGDGDLMLTSVATRVEVVLEARSWLRTPYELRGTVKHVGTDCGNFLLCVFRACGFDVPSQHECVSNDWWCNTASSATYVRNLMRYCKKTFEGISYQSTRHLPGNIITVITRNGVDYNHGGIITAWPRVIHVTTEDGVKETNAVRNCCGWFSGQTAVWDPWAYLEREA